jgi:hypothetical protein
MPSGDRASLITRHQFCPGDGQADDGAADLLPMRGAGSIEKTEAAYHNVVVRLLTELRMSGAIPFESITDESRRRRENRRATRQGSIGATLCKRARTTSRSGRRRKRSQV